MSYSIIASFHHSSVFGISILYFQLEPNILCIHINFNVSLLCQTEHYSCRECCIMLYMFCVQRVQCTTWGSWTPSTTPPVLVLERYVFARTSSDSGTGSASIGTLQKTRGPTWAVHCSIPPTTPPHSAGKLASI